MVTSSPRHSWRRRQRRECLKPSCRGLVVSLSPAAASRRRWRGRCWPGCAAHAARRRGRSHGARHWRLPLREPRRPSRAESSWMIAGDGCILFLHSQIRRATTMSTVGDTWRWRLCQQYKRIFPRRWRIEHEAGVRCQSKGYVGHQRYQHGSMTKHSCYKLFRSQTTNLGRLSVTPINSTFICQTHLAKKWFWWQRLHIFQQNLPKCSKIC